MLECLIIGDSIAVGAKSFRPDCVAYAQSGITSHGWDKKFGHKDLTAEAVIISLSTNDWEKANTYDKLIQIRDKVNARRVYWIVPNEESKSHVASLVRKIAVEYKDILIVPERWAADKIHPSWAGYKRIADQIK